MKKVSNKLRLKCKSLRIKVAMKFKIVQLKITKPFKIFSEAIQRYKVLKRIDIESKNEWEKYCKRKELEEKDKIELQTQELACLNIHFIGALSRATMAAFLYANLETGKEELEAGEKQDEMDEYKKLFQKEKNDLVELIDKYNQYEMIKFDEKIKAEIITWECEGNKKEMLNIKQERLITYIKTLKIS